MKESEEGVMIWCLVFLGLMIFNLRSFFGVYVIYIFALFRIGLLAGLSMAPCNMFVEILQIIFSCSVYNVVLILIIYISAHSTGFAICPILLSS